MAFYYRLKAALILSSTLSMTHVAASITPQEQKQAELRCLQVQARQMQWKLRHGTSCIARLKDRYQQYRLTQQINKLQAEMNIIEQ